MSDDKRTIDVPVPKPPAAGPPPPPPPKNPGFVTFTCDGHEVVAKPGTNMIDAAKTVGVEIPYYCYHPRLSIAANCRMCMVESSAAPPGKLVPACQSSIGEGHVIQTNTDKVKSQQKMVMEFLLLNHPVDCSICDQAGECKLQDYYMRYDFKGSRLEGSKIMRNKRKVLNDLVVIDQERCVLCTRCVRFMDEVAKAPQLGVFGRGSHEVVDVAPEFGKLESNYSANIVDICPVGALLNRDFRFKARSWFLSASPSVCTGCARGCNTFSDFMGQDVYRFRPRENEAINKAWMCDEGRMSYKGLNKNRVHKSLIELAEATSQEAVSKVAARLKGSSVAVAVSPVLSNEDLLAVFGFARDVLKAKHVYLSGRPNGIGDDFLMLADKNPNRKGLEWVAKAFGVEVKPATELATAISKGQVKNLMAFGQDFPLEIEASKLDFFAISAMSSSALTSAAHVVLAAASHVEDEGTFTQEAGIVQRFRRAFPPQGESLPHWKWATLLSKALGIEVAFTSSREVFRGLSMHVPELKEYAWDKLAPMNQNRPGIATMPAGSDGRPPGWREQGVPNLRGLTLGKEG
jgi:NADH-quinone oxidoreductase subunit G